MAEFNAHFDARFSGEQVMAGFYTQGTLSEFSLETEDPQTEDAPSGKWTGKIGGALAIGGPSEHYAAKHGWGDLSLVIEVTANGDGEIESIALSPQYVLPEDPARNYSSDVAYRNPAEGVWFRFWGGLTEFENYHAITPVQRHAYDLVIFKDGATFTGDGSRNEDYWAFELPALAPASGTVVVVENGMPDMNPGESLSQLSPEEAESLHPAGNHVAIQTAPDEYVFVAHMQEGSVTVAKGDSVDAGDEIGRVGNSGNTSGSHVHIHVQDQADFFAPSAIGLPLVFFQHPDRW